MKIDRTAAPLSFAVLIALSSGCGSSSDSTSRSDASTGPKLAIVSVSGAPLAAVAGDGIALKVVVVAADGSISDLPADAVVTWTSPAVITTLPPDSAAASPIPAPAADPTVAWVANPSRPDVAATLANVLFVLDPGTNQNATAAVSASVTGASPSGAVSASIAIDPTPAGDWKNGATLYGGSGANCAACHGITGDGSPPNADGTSYALAGKTYDFPAPGLNAVPGNTAGDPAWTAALFAVAARADMDNGGIALRSPMPDWLAATNPATGALLTTQDFADIYAFLKTQTQ